MAERILDVPLQAQERTRWCWAAAALGIRDYRVAGAQRLAQCEVVSLVTQDQATCEEPERQNVEGRLDLALGALQIQCSTACVSTFEFTDVHQQLIAKQLPLGARIADNVTGSGHIVVVIGCDPSGETVVVADPWGTPGTAAPRYRMPFRSLKHNYGGMGSLYRHLLCFVMAENLGEKPSSNGSIALHSLSTFCTIWGTCFRSSACGKVRRDARFHHPPTRSARKNSGAACCSSHGAPCRSSDSGKTECAEVSLAAWRSSSLQT